MWTETYKMMREYDNVLQINSKADCATLEYEVALYLQCPFIARMVWTQNRRLIAVNDRKPSNLYINAISIISTVISETQFYYHSDASTSKKPYLFLYMLRMRPITATDRNIYTIFVVQ